MAVPLISMVSTIDSFIMGTECKEYERPRIYKFAI